MDHLEDVKTRIRERLKKLDEIKTEYKNIHNKNHPTINTNQYSEMIEARLKHIEAIKAEIFNSQKVIKSSNTEPIINKNQIRQIENPIIPDIVPDSNYSVKSVGKLPYQNPQVHTSTSNPNPNPIPSPPSSLAIPKRPDNLPETNHAVAHMQREQRKLERDRRMKEAASSGCGCRKVK